MERKTVELIIVIVIVIVIVVLVLRTTQIMYVENVHSLIRQRPKGNG